MSDLECPYCGADCKVCHDDGFGYAEDVAHEMECHDCGKNFVFNTAISFHYSPAKADCLNGSPHRFTDWSRLWENDAGVTIGTRRCKDCGHREQAPMP